MDDLKDSLIEGKSTYIKKLLVTREELERIASDMGLFPFFPQANELFLDIDQPMLRRFMNDPVPSRITEVLATNGYQIVGELQTTSKSGNTHIYLRLSMELPFLVRVALQAALRSDPVAETLTCLRLLAGSEESALHPLFETPTEALKVNKWRQSHRS